jgi:hypothetical protein
MTAAIDAVSNSHTSGGTLANLRVNPPHSGVTALAGGKRRAAGRAGYAHR